MTMSDAAMSLAKTTVSSLQSIKAAGAVATLALEPENATDAFRLCGLYFASRLLPKSIASQEAAFTILVTGRELGLTAMQSFRSIHVIEGRPTMSADLMVALTKRSPECEWFRLVESNAKVATYETKRRGMPAPTRLSFTIDEAKEAGLLGKDNWRKYPAAMLRARASASLCRIEYPDVMIGVYETDELDDRDSGPTYDRPSREEARASFDEMTRPAPKAPLAAQDVVPEPPTSNPGVDGEAAQFEARIQAAASVEELSAIAKDLGAAVSARRVTQSEAFALRSEGHKRRAAIKAALKAEQEAAAAEPQAREPGVD
jgi:hypothetical protein